MIQSRVRTYIQNLLHYRRWRIASFQKVLQVEHDFYRNYIKLGMTVFDIGANVGELTRLFSGYVGQSGWVHAFEPTSATYNMLTEMCADLSNVILNHKAVSDQLGVLDLHIYDEAHHTWNSLARRAIEVKPIGIEQVSTISVDEYCKQQNIHQIDLLKIDVEGAEYQVLQGARRMFMEKRIRCVLFEFGGTTLDMGNNPKEITAYLKKVGYRVRNLVKSDPSFPGGNNPNTVAFAMHLATPEGN